jgi:hypothetical protein
MPYSRMSLRHLPSALPVRPRPPASPHRAPTALPSEPSRLDREERYPLPRWSKASVVVNCCWICYKRTHLRRSLARPDRYVPLDFVPLNPVYLLIPGHTFIPPNASALAPKPPRPLFLPLPLQHQSHPPTPQPILPKTSTEPRFSVSPRNSETPRTPYPNR